MVVASLYPSTKLDRQAISVKNGGMGFFKPTQNKIALIIICSIIVLGMAWYILGGRTGKHTSSYNQREFLQVTPIPSLQPSITKLPTSNTISIRSEATKIPTAPLPIPCSAKDIKATVFWHAAMAAELGEVYYTNISSHSCSLFGYPIIHLKDESGFVYQAQVTNTPNIYYDNVKTPTNVILQGNITATSSFAWRGCVPVPKGSILVLITLPHESTQLLAQAVDNYSNGNAIKHEVTPTCPDDVTPANQSWLDVGSFELFQGQ